MKCHFFSLFFLCAALFGRCQQIDSNFVINTAHQQAIKFNAALNSGDLDFLFEHIDKKETEGLTATQWKKEASKFYELRKKDNVEFKENKVQKASRVIRCGQNLQCKMNQETTELIDKKEYSFKTYLIGISEDGGKQWRFINGGNLGAEGLKKNYPDICVEVLK